MKRIKFFIGAVLFAAVTMFAAGCEEDNAEPTNVSNNTASPQDSIVNPQDSTARPHDTIPSTPDTISVTYIDTMATACEFFMWYGNRYTVSGDYTDTISTADHMNIVTLHLTINTATSHGYYITIDGAYTWTDMGADGHGTGETYSESGTYIGNIYTDVHGCDARDTLHLVINTNTPTDYNTEDWVDLGLPSGLLWATRNVGASRPEDYGDYFAWGETQSKDNYWWDTYRYANGSANTLTKYCDISEYGYNGFTDNQTTLLSDDDAAAANVTGSRMPTRADWEELVNNTTTQWTNINGANGPVITGPNGKSIFLPAAGYRASAGFGRVGIEGRYWLSSLSRNCPPSAWYFGFSCGLHVFQYYGETRERGFTVRPVKDAH